MPGSSRRAARDGRPRLRHQRPRSAFPPELRDRATSLETELGRVVERDAVLAETLAALARRYDDLARRTVRCYSRRLARACAARGWRARDVDDNRGHALGHHRGDRRPGALLVRIEDASSGLSPGNSRGYRFAFVLCVLCADVVMLLAIDVGNTNIVLGVFDGSTLVQSWRLQTLRERTSDELGLLVDGLFAHSRIERGQIGGVILGSVVPPLTGTIRQMVERYFGVKALVVDPDLEHRDADPLQEPGGSRRRSHRQRDCGIREVRQGARRAAADGRRRFRHGDDARCGEREGRISGRRDLPGRPDLGRRIVSARGAPAAHRRAQAADGHRPDDSRRDGVGAVLRLRRDGRGARAADDAKSSAARPSASRPAAWPT